MKFKVLLVGVIAGNIVINNASSMEDKIVHNENKHMEINNNNLYKNVENMLNKTDNNTIIKNFQSSENNFNITNKYLNNFSDMYKIDVYNNIKLEMNLRYIITFNLYNHAKKYFLDLAKKQLEGIKDFNQKPEYSKIDKNRKIIGHVLKEVENRHRDDWLQYQLKDSLDVIDATRNDNLEWFVRNHLYQCNAEQEFNNFKKVMEDDESDFSKKELYIDNLIYKGYITNTKIIEYMSYLYDEDLENMQNNNLYTNFYTRFEPTGLKNLTDDDKHFLNKINNLVFNMLHKDLEYELINNFDSDTSITIQQKVFNELVQVCIEKKYKNIVNRKYLQFIRDIIKNNIYKFACEYFSEIYKTQYENNEYKIENIIESIKDKELSKYIYDNLKKIKEPDYSGNEKLESYDNNYREKTEKKYTASNKRNSYNKLF